MSRAAAVAEALSGADSLAIVCHDDPDPDSFASAMALETIAHQGGVDDVVIVYGGEISHQQNRAFVNVLDVDPREGVDVDLFEYDRIALVDHSREAANSIVPPTVGVDVVVDHHPGATVEAPVTDVRTDYGATATIVVEYLQNLDLDVTTRLATALLFALHRERLDFVREPTEREYRAALAMYPDADLEALEQLYGSAFSAATIDAIGRAISSRTRRGSALVATVGRTRETDALPQAADYLLNLEGVDTVLVFGVVGNAIRLSARSIDPRVNAGEVLEDAFDRFGTVGGHPDMAGGRIDLGLFAEEDDDEAIISLVGARIERRYFDALHLEDEPEK